MDILYIYLVPYKRIICEHFETPIQPFLIVMIDSGRRSIKQTVSTMSFNSKKIFIGNLPFTITKNELESMFSSVSSILLPYYLCIHTYP